MSSNALAMSFPLVISKDFGEIKWSFLQSGEDREVCVGLCFFPSPMPSQMLEQQLLLPGPSTNCLRLFLLMSPETGVAKARLPNHPLSILACSKRHFHLHHVPELNIFKPFKTSHCSNVKETKHVIVEAVWQK